MQIPWNQQEPFRTALDALERYQWSVFPLDEDKRPPQTGEIYPDGTPKRLAWKHLQTRRPLPKEVLLWQKTYNPCAWAVITGAISAQVDLDFDGEIGRETCRRLELKPHVQTGSGGYHTYFVHPGWSVPTVNGKSKQALGKLWPGLDIRGDGGYAAFCGRNSHGPYIWLRDPVPYDLSILPEDLRAMLGLLYPPGPARQAHELLMQALQQSKRGRNDAGFWLACQLRDKGYEQAEACETMLKYASQVAPVNSKGQYEPYPPEEALSSLASAYQREPRTPSQYPPPPSIASGPVANGLPIIILTDAHLREMVDQSVAAIKQQQGDEPWLFVRSSRLVNVARDEQQRPQIHEMGLTHVTEVLSHAADFYHVRKPAGEDKEPIYTPARPPRDVSEQILARLRQPPFLPFPSLIGLIEVPILRPDGSICEQPGYDRATSLYYMPPAGSRPCHVPTNPTAQDVGEALALIWDGFGEFCYASQADRANTLALLMTALVRPVIKGDIPLAVIDATKPGSGKGILANSTAMIATGRPAPILVPPSTEEEWGKCLIAMLIEGQTIICIDNVTGRLQSAKLDAVLTSELSQGRVLGQSATVHVPNRATWMTTGNNIQLGGDLVRRSYWIRLDARMSQPWLRTKFRHTNLVDWVRELRMELVGALLTLIRAWYVGGQQRATGLPAMGTFSPWVNTVGSILAYIGVPGFLDNQIRHYEASDETSVQWEIFLQAWHDKIGSNWIKTADLVKLIDERSPELLESADQIDLSEALPERLQILLQEKPSSFKTRLGLELKKRVDTCFGENNLHLEQGGKDRKGFVLWRVSLGYTEVVGTTSHAKKVTPSQESAEVAEVAEVVPANSHRENEIHSQEKRPKEIHKEGWDRPRQPRQPRQNQGEEVPPTSLGNSLIPIEDRGEDPIESSALQPPPAPLSLSNDQGVERITSRNANTSNNYKTRVIVSLELIESDNEKWERFRMQ